MESVLKGSESMQFGIMDKYGLRERKKNENRKIPKDEEATYHCSNYPVIRVSN
jgi:hypothetical protein